jgi:lysophospholipid acyltransferase (LPLAT)-like uncharacterized protein
LRPTEGPPTIAAVQNRRDEPELRNTIYEQKTRSGRRLTPARRWAYAVAAPVALSAARLMLSSCRVVRIVGAEHIIESLKRAPSFIPVYWHQHQLFCATYLLGLRAAGVKPGFLVSPSVDGEFGAMLVRRLGGEVIRGSSSHTGARTLRDFYEALVRDGISPVITPDGPKGPPWVFKGGALMLAQLSQRPIIPISYFASRAWHAGWDSFVIPQPFARIVIAVGEPVYIPKGTDAAALQRWQGQMEQRLKGLFETAKSTAA